MGRAGGGRKGVLSTKSAVGAGATEARRRTDFAGARAAAFALGSRLVASPFDPTFVEEAQLPEDLPEALVTLADALPYDSGLAALAEPARAQLAADPEALAREYGALFEVGSSGPPLPIREEVAQGELLGPKAKEEIVRFYEHFGYPLHAERRWAPDHLSVELEFLYLLAFREAGAEHRKDAAPFARAERDFLERHPLVWLPQLAKAVEHRSRHAWLRALFPALALWLERDHAWLRVRLSAEEPQ